MRGGGLAHTGSPASSLLPTATSLNFEPSLRGKKPLVPLRQSCQAESPVVPMQQQIIWTGFHVLTVYTPAPPASPDPQPLCVLPFLSPHVLMSPCHQCRVLHDHTCSHMPWAVYATLLRTHTNSTCVCASPPPGMRDHPPIPITDLADNIERLKANDGLKFSQEYEVRHPPHVPSVYPGQILFCPGSQLGLGIQTFL